MSVTLEPAFPTLNLSYQLEVEFRMDSLSRILSLCLVLDCLEPHGHGKPFPTVK